MSYDLLGLYISVVNQLKDSPLSTLQAMSVELSASRHTLGRAVRQHARMTFRELRRMAMAMQADRLLLSKSERSIKEIAFDVGYSSASSFSRAFHNTHGVSPSCYRGGEHRNGIHSATK